MFFMKAVIGVVQIFLYMMTLVMTYAYYANVKVDVPEWGYSFLGVAIVGVSVVIAIGHVIGGGIMGMTAGGVLSGMRLGLTLGLCVALARLWPFAAIIGVVGFLTKAPTWHWVLAIICALVFYLIQVFVNYIWQSFER